MIKKSHIDNPVRKYFISTIYLVFVLFLLIGQAQSQELNKRGVSILIPKNTPQYLEVVRSIKEKLKKNEIGDPVDIIFLSDNHKLAKKSLDNKKLVVLIGSRSLDYYLKSQNKSPYITSLITRSAFEYITSKNIVRNGFVGGVSIDQPPRRFLSLAKMVVPNLKKIALIMGPEVIKNKKNILRGFSKNNLVYNLFEILLNDNPINKLRKAYEENEVLILFPDRAKFNNSISRWVLTLSAQYQIPVISYSKKYANAGALASIFSTSTQIGDQTAEMMISFLKNSRNKPKKLVDPKYFDIHINKSVENALGLTLPSKFELLNKIAN